MGLVGACTAPPVPREAPLGGSPTVGVSAGSPSPGVQAGAARIAGPLHTVGTRIVDAQDRDVRFTGIDVVGLQSGMGNFVGAGPVGPCGGWRILPPEEFDQIAAWGFNSVRIGISWGNLEPDPPLSGRHDYDQAYASYVDDVVHAFTERGIAVILQMAQSKWSPAFRNVRVRGGGIRCRGYGMPGWLYPDAGSISIDAAKLRFFASARMRDGYAHAWTFLAARYADDPMVVGLDLLNEPYVNPSIAPSALHLNAFYAELGAAIRSVNPDALLIFQDTQDRGDGVFGLTHPLSFAGAVYSFHLYVDDWQPDGIARVQRYLTRARAWNVPLWIGEFDAFTYASTEVHDPTWHQDLAAMMAFCRDQVVGWSLFAYSDRRLLQPGTSLPKPGVLAILRSGF
jgi:hypothetical protein